MIKVPRRQKLQLVSIKKTSRLESKYGDDTVMVTAMLPQPLYEELFFAASLSATEARKLQRHAKAGALVRVCKGVYAPPLDREELAVLVRRNWSRIAGVVVPGAWCRTSAP